MGPLIISNLKVNGVESSSVVGIGSNLLIGVVSSGKTQVGHGVIMGDFSSVPSLGAGISDPDLLDTPMFTVWGGRWM